MHNPAAEPSFLFIYYLSPKRLTITTLYPGASVASLNDGSRPVRNEMTGENVRISYYHNNQQNNQSWVSGCVRNDDSLMVPRSLDNCSQKQSQVQGDEGAIPVSLLARKTNGAVA